MEKLINYYDILGIDFEEAKDMEAETFRETVLNHAGKVNDKLNKEYEDGIITEEELETRKEDVRQAAVVLLDADLRARYDEDLAADLEAHKTKRGTKVTGEEEAPATSKKGKTVLKVLGVIALCGLIIWGVKSCTDNHWLERNGSTEPTTAVEQNVDTKDGYNTNTSSSTDTTAASEDETESSETADDETKEEETKEEETREDAFEARDMGSVEDPALVSQHAAELLENLNAINVLSVSDAPYTQEYIQNLILFAYGKYVPSNMAEVDQMYLDLIHILQSPLYNEGGYGFHIAYANGVEELKAEAENTQAGNNILLVDAFLGYGTEDSATYQFAKWLEGKRVAIYSTTDRDQISAIYNEVGQAMAEIMKGNGFTFTVTVNNVERTYTVTSEMLANKPVAAEVAIGQFLLIMQNRRDQFIPETGETITERSTWEVTNMYNPGTVDVVTFDEENAWVNPDCQEKWLIDDAMAPYHGYTLDQISQMTIEGMAQNLGFMANPKEFTYIEIPNLFQQDGPSLEHKN